MTLIQKISTLWATWFYTGLSPKAPGTVGSLAALPVAYLAAWYGVQGVFVFALFVLLTGWAATAVVIRGQAEKDPGSVVIDEVLGQTLTFVFVIESVTSSPVFLILGFILFRFFDIVKVWPASWFDKKMHTALGVMLDDAVAGLYAACVLYVLHFVI